jgi:hypothetical protein
MSKLNVFHSESAVKSYLINRENKDIVSTSQNLLTLASVRMSTSFSLWGRVINEPGSPLLFCSVLTKHAQIYFNSSITLGAIIAISGTLNRSYV